MISLEELDRRVRQLEDERELRQLLTWSGLTADLGKNAAYVSLFAEDGEIDHDPRVTPRKTRGHAAIREYVDEGSHKTIVGRCQHHHLSGPIVFEINGDEAWAEGCSLVFLKGEGTSAIADGGIVLPDIRVMAANFNRWTFRRVAGAWRIQSRRARLLGDDGLEAVLSGSMSRWPLEQSA